MSLNQRLFDKHISSVPIIARRLVMRRKVAMKIISTENCQKDTRLMESRVMKILSTCLTNMNTIEQIHQVLIDRTEIYGKNSNLASVI